MKERLLEEIQKGSKGAVMKKHIITYLIYNENSTITDLACRSPQAAPPA